MKFVVHVMPRKVVLDTQGRSVEAVLKQQGFSVQACRVGKRIELEVQATDSAAAKVEVEKMAREILTNPLVEDFQIEVQA